MPRLKPNAGPPAQPVPLPRASFTVKEGCQILGLSRSTLFKMIQDKEIQSVKIRGRRMIPADAIPILLARLQKEGA